MSFKKLIADGDMNVRLEERNKSGEDDIDIVGDRISQASFGFLNFLSEPEKAIEADSFHIDAPIKTVLVELEKFNDKICVKLVCLSFAHRGLTKAAVNTISKNSAGGSDASRRCLLRRLNM